MGRPSTFSQETADAICERLMAGESLRSICLDEHMPGRPTVFAWLASQDQKFKSFQDQYVRARDVQADTLAEQTIDISDEECVRVKPPPGVEPDGDDGLVEVAFDAAAVQRNRLRVDARKWYAGKLAPKKYGDKVQTELTGPNGGPIQVQDMTDAQLAAIAAGSGN